MGDIAGHALGFLWGHSGLILGILGILFGGATLLALQKLRTAITEAHEAWAKWKAMRDPSSPGGATVTPEEEQALLKETSEAIAALKDLGGSLLPLIVKWWKKRK